MAERIHSHFGLPFGVATREAVETHANANPKGKHGRHDYSLEEFGLQPERVRERFADYIERFQISPS